MTNIKTNICIVGGGIVGSFLASELANKGLSVLIIEVPSRQAPFSVLSKGVNIDQDVNMFGLGGNESVWSQLTSFLSSQEWDYYKKKFDLNMAYEDIERYAKAVQPYGFCALDFLTESLDLNLKSQLKLKKFVKRKSQFLFSDLLKKRKNIKIYHSVINFIDSRKKMIKVGNDKYQISFDCLCFAAGGLGNYYIINKFLPDLIKKNKKHTIKLHFKEFVGIYNLNDNPNLVKELGWKEENGVDYYYGLYKSPDNLENSFDEDLFQFLPLRWYENKGFIYIKNTIWHKPLYDLISVLKSKIYSNKLSFFLNPSFLFFLKNLFLSLPSIIIHFIYKLFNLKAKLSKYILLYHHAAESTIKYDEDSNSIMIDSDKPFINKKSLNKVFKSNNIECKVFFKDFDFKDANHFCSTTYLNSTNPKKNSLDGQIDLEGDFYAVGTSALPFVSNTNPTFLALCFTMKTIEKIHHAKSKTEI